MTVVRVAVPVNALVVKVALAATMGIVVEAGPRAAKAEVETMN